MEYQLVVHKDVSPLTHGAALNLAVAKLRRHGHSVEAADIPGLYVVSGYPELTTNQLFSVAASLPT